VKGPFARSLARWTEAARTFGFFLLLVAGSAALGMAIAWPLWLFATSRKRLFTLCVLCLLAAVILLLAVRAVVRRRHARQDPGRPTRTVLSVILGILLGIAVPAGAYMTAVLLFRGLWILAVPAVPIWLALLWLLGFLRRKAKFRKQRAIPAENRGE
jgi:hypothetical protein